MSILMWLLYGLVIGALAKFVMPGNQAMGWITTIILGILGSMLGGFIAQRLLGLGEDGAMWDLPTMAISVLGALLVLFIYGAVTRRR